MWLDSGVLFGQAAVDVVPPADLAGGSGQEQVGAGVRVDAPRVAVGDPHGPPVRLVLDEAGWCDDVRVTVFGAELSCHHRANRLLAEQRDSELRQMVDEGHRCAFVRLMELLVDAERVEDLREIALGGDERAGVTLAEYWVQLGDEAALRREMVVLPRTGLWLAGLLKDLGRHSEAVEVLTALADNV